MRITHVVRSDSFAGVERYICDVANLLADRGHDLLVVGGEPGRMRSELGERVRWAPAASVREAAKALVPAGRQSIVHAHMTAAELAATVTWPLHRGKVVATRHFAAARGGSAPVRLLGRALAAGMVAQIAISEYVAQAIGEPSVVIPNGVRSVPQARLSAPIAVMLQRLEEEKRPDVAIRAWAASSLPGAGWTLLVGGRGRLAPELDALVQSLGVGASVRALGYVDTTDAFLADASIFLAPAPAEPFGLSVVEAMARGIPVVAAGGGAHLETVGLRDLLFPVGDFQACARVLDTLAADADLRRSTGEQMRNRQLQLFTLENHVDALCGLYERVVGAEGGGRTSIPLQ